MQPNFYNALINLLDQREQQQAIYKPIKALLSKKNAAKTAEKIILASHPKKSYIPLTDKLEDEGVQRVVKESDHL